jgi:predicted dehydrogenase
MGYRLFSSGVVGGWMSHMSDLVHSLTGCGLPVSAVAHGGTFAPVSKPGRDCPDNYTAIVEYPEGFTTCFWTHFGNGANDYMKFFGSKGTMTTGAPDGWPNGIEPRVSGEGSNDPDKVAEDTALDNSLIESHMENWFNCMRSRKQPNAGMEAGYRQGVAVLLADAAYVKGCKMTFDPQSRTIKPT